MEEQHISEELVSHAMNTLGNSIEIPSNVNVVITQFENNQELNQKINDETATVADMTDEFYYAIMNYFGVLYGISGLNELYTPENEEMNTVIDNQIITNIDNLVKFVKYIFMKAIYYNEIGNIEFAKESVIKMLITMKQNESIVAESIGNIIAFHQNSSLSENHYQMVRDEE
jgi:hypothetical protein